MFMLAQRVKKNALLDVGIHVCLSITQNKTS